MEFYQFLPAKGLLGGDILGRLGNSPSNFEFKLLLMIAKIVTVCSVRGRNIYLHPHHVKFQVYTSSEFLISPPDSHI